VLVVKHSRNGKANQRCFKANNQGPVNVIAWSSPGSHKAPDPNAMFRLSQVCRIAKGCDTRVFARSKNSPDPGKCFSVFLRDRTVDMEAKDTQERDALHKGFGLLVQVVRGR
jgi:hypothetical protein